MQHRVSVNPLSVLLCLWFNIETYLLFSIENMARTKQTPRNPNLERPSAAMGSDVQER